MINLIKKIDSILKKNNIGKSLLLLILFFVSIYFCIRYISAISFLYLVLLVVILLLSSIIILFTPKLVKYTMLIVYNLYVIAFIVNFIITGKYFNNSLFSLYSLRNNNTTNIIFIIFLILLLLLWPAIIYEFKIKFIQYKQD